MGGCRAKDFSPWGQDLRASGGRDEQLAALFMRTPVYKRQNGGF